MEFTYRAYEHMLDLLSGKGYSFTDYKNYNQVEKPVILRHDVDFSLEKALIFAELEETKRIKSTYFILLSTDFYNIFYRESSDILRKIKALGHDFGLHFDEKKYMINSEKNIGKYVKNELSYLEGVLDCKINVVSMHRPSKWILGNDIHFNGVINSYSKTFIGDFKYLSDSRMHWREDALNIIEKEIFDKLHILTHPFWYSNKVETMKYKLLSFIDKAKIERYYNIKDNFRYLEEIVTLEDIEII